MGEITISTAWGWLLAACAAVVTLAKAWEIVKKWGKGDIAKRLEEADRKLQSDAIRIKGLEDGQAITMRALLAIVNHEIDGNNIEGLKNTRDALQRYLIER